MKIQIKLLPLWRIIRRPLGPALLLWLLPAFTGPQAATDKHFKLEDPFFSPPRTAFSCDGDSTLNVAPDGQWTVISSTTAFSESRLNGYSCISWPERGPEMIYRLAVSDTLQFWAGLVDDGALDLDLFLLGGCDSDACLDGANVEVSGNIGPLGTYFLVVDVYSDDYDQEGGPFTLAFEGRVVGLPQSICDAPDEQIDLVAYAWDPDLQFQGDLYGRTNLLQSYDCSPYLERGSEIWFEIPVWQATRFEVNVVPYAYPTLDLALWLFADCGPEAVCLDFADENTGGEAESLVWTAESGSPAYLYLGVDCTEMPSDETYAGEFVLSFGSSIELLGVPLDICQNPDHVLDFENLAAHPDSVFASDLYGQSNLLDEYDPCGASGQAGGELWFEIPSWQATSFTAEVTAADPGLDLALWLLAGCGPEAVCLGFVDDTAGGGDETLTWVKQEGGPTTIYLGIDCAESPAAEDADGLFSLSFGSSIVPAEKSTWGGLRARFR